MFSPFFFSFLLCVYISVCGAYEWAYEGVCFECTHAHTHTYTRLVLALVQLVSGMCLAKAVEGLHQSGLR